MNHNKMDLLFKYARNHKFAEFDSLFCEMEAGMPPDEMLDDLKNAEQSGGTLQFPLLLTS